MGTVRRQCHQNPHGRQKQAAQALAITCLAAVVVAIMAGCSVASKPHPGDIPAAQRSRQAAPLVRNRAKITSHFSAGPFGLQLRCSLVSDPLPGYAPHSRLAGGQNFCAVKHEFIFARSLTRLENCAAANDARQRADRRIASLLGTHAAVRLAALTYILHTPGQSAGMRIYALRQIFATDHFLAMALLKKYLPTWQQWPMLFYACKVCVQCHDQQLLGPLILSLKRPAIRYQLPNRPEARAIREITGQPVRQVLAMTFLRPGPMDVRIAALALLRQENGPAFVRHLLNHSNYRDPMISAMQWWIHHYHHVAVSTTEILWLQELYVERRSPMMMRCARHWRELRGHVRHHTVAPAQAYLLAHLQITPLDLSRTGLLQAVAAEWRRQKHLRRPRPYPHAPGYPNPTLRSNAPRLTRLNLVLLQTLFTALNHPAFQQMVYRAGIRSMYNHASETGGLICYANAAAPAANRPHGEDESLTLHTFPPLLNRSGGVYVSSPMLLAATVHALSEFIFHFQRVHNARYVGPAVGDLAYVRRMRCAVVIFTSVASRAFDATLDLPDGAVVDLGIFHVRGPAMPSGG